MTQSRQRRALHAAEARAMAAAAAAAAAAGATTECFTTEWANQLLRALWPSTLEPRVAAKLQEKLDVSSVNTWTPKNFSQLVILLLQHVAKC